jgi:hypothetical protein
MPEITLLTKDNNSILYYLCAELTATRPITDIVQRKYNNNNNNTIIIEEAADLLDYKYMYLNMGKLVQSSHINYINYHYEAVTIIIHHVN